MATTGPASELPTDEIETFQEDLLEAATGMVLRPGTLEELATEAGFSAVDVLDVETFFFRFYHLQP